MTNLTPVPGWDDVRQLEASDKAKAGAGGVMNSQAQALLNRTERINQFEQDGTGAQIRPIQDKLQDIVCVMDFMTQAQITDARKRTTLTDHTAAFDAAFAKSSRIYVPAGTYNVTSIVGNGKFMFGDGTRASIIRGTDKTQPTVNVWGICGLIGLQIFQANFTTTDVYPSSIPALLGGPNGEFVERTSVFKDLLIRNGTEGLSSRATIYSTIFRNIELSRCTVPMHLICPSATGNVVENIYIDNWDDFSTQTRMKSPNMVWLEGSWSESKFTQLNFEWCEVSGACLLLNQFDNCTIDSVHMEGLIFNGSNAAGISAIGFGTGSPRTNRVKVKTLTAYNNTINSGTQFSLFAGVSNCEIDADGISGYNNTNNGTARRFMRLGDLTVAPGPIFYPGPMWGTDIFNGNDFVPVVAGYPACIRSRYSRQIRDTAAPSLGTYSIGTIIENSAPGDNDTAALIKTASGGFRRFGPIYEEGTFTPNASGSTTAGGATYTTQTGRYTKIGRVVYFESAVVLAALGTAPTGSFQVDLNDIPYATPAATGFVGITVGRNSNLTLTAGKGVTGYMNNSSKAVTLRYTDGSGDVSASAWTATSVVYVSGFFQL